LSGMCAQSMKRRCAARSAVWPLRKLIDVKIHSDSHSSKEVCCSVRRAFCRFFRGIAHHCDDGPIALTHATTRVADNCARGPACDDSATARLIRSLAAAVRASQRCGRRCVLLSRRPMVRHSPRWLRSSIPSQPSPSSAEPMPCAARPNVTALHCTALHCTALRKAKQGTLLRYLGLAVCFGRDRQWLL
jgi:hypothetical protein